MPLQNIVAQIKANLLKSDPEKYYSIYPNERPTTNIVARILSAAPPTVALASNSGATLPALITPTTAPNASTVSGGVQPIQVQQAPFVQSSTTNAQAKPTESKSKLPWIIGAVVLAVVLLLIARR